MDEEFVNKDKDLVLQVRCIDAPHTIKSMSAITYSRP